jgi:catechol 2,3-dioxygenase-like lactoylglutathione lyase family enzyme
MSGLPGFERLDHVAITVPDLDAAMAFYAKTFGFKELYRLGPFDASQMPRMPDGRDWTAAHVNVPGAKLSLGMMRMGEGTSMLELFQYDAPADRSATPPRNCDAGGHHLAFKVRDIDVAARYLSEHGCRLMDGPVVLDEGPSAGLKLRYVLDPWGNQLELVEYVTQAWMSTTG